MVARFVPQKDPALLLRAAATLPGLEVWMAGDGPDLKAVQTLATELGMGERIQFLGNREDVPVLLEQSDVFCLCSNYEGLPISILEAMRAGLPVIASDVGGVREAVAHGYTGLLVTHNDLVSWRLALAQLLDDPALRQTMGQAGRARFRSHFTVAQLLDQTWAVYQDVLSRRRPQRPGNYSGNA